MFYYAGQLPLNKAGMLVNKVDMGERFYDPSAPYRDMVVGGMLSNGPGVFDDPRSKDETSL